MRHSWTHLSEDTNSVQLLKIDDFSITNAMIKNNQDYIESRCSIYGYEWEIRFYPAHSYCIDLHFLALELVLLSKPRGNSVRANLSGRLVDPGNGLNSVAGSERTVTTVFRRPLDCSHVFYFGAGVVRGVVQSLGQSKGISFTVECNITVLKDIKAIPFPSTDLQKHLGELLRSQAGADVTFVV
ncbi:hypothetical protein ACP4OV_028058 [Aristida adscensionis]